MSILQQAQDVEAGNALLRELRTYGTDMDGVVDAIKQLAMNYELFRGNLSDQDDKTFADASLQSAIERNKPKLDSLSANEKARVNSVMAGLGFSPTV